MAVLLTDIVFVKTWYPIEVPKFYNPVTSLMLPPGEKNQWEGLKTAGLLRREKGIKRKAEQDSMYKVGSWEDIYISYIPVYII